MRTLLAVILCCISVATPGAAPEFAVGQVWSYNTRPGEEQSTLVIDKIEDDPKLGRIYHISISGVQIKLGAKGVINEMPHMPVSLKTLTLSCTTLVRQGEPNPHYLPGYRLWKEAFDAGRAGVYTVSISEILSATEKTLQKPEPSSVTPVQVPSGDH
jgi:hypothetical protein